MRIKIWDLPLRLFHWLLVLAIGAAWASAELSEDLGDNVIEIHGKIGLFILGLVTFRIVWGFVGSTHARFTNFFPTPSRLKAYLSGESHPLGHNPIGALSVLALLSLVLAQAVTGLFANDDIAFHGPLYVLVNSEISNRITKLHHLGFDGLFILIGLHIAAIFFYLHIKKNNLVRPMVTGYKENTAGDSASGGGLVAFVFALIIAVGVVYVATGAFLPKPVIETTTPNW